MRFQGTRGLIKGPLAAGTGTSGGMHTCRNLVVRNLGVYEPRPGITANDTYTSGTYTRIYVDPITGGLIRSRIDSSKLQFGNKNDGGLTTWTTAPTEYAVSALSSDDTTVLLLSNSGLRRNYLMSTSATATNLSNTDIGYVPEGLDLTLTVGSTGSGFLANSTQCAYRVVFGIRDGNNRVFLGAPGGRYTVSNTSGSAQNVTVRLTMPSEAGYTFTANTTISSTTMSAVSSAANIVSGHRLYGTGIAAGTYVQPHASFPTSLTLSTAATANGTGITVTATRLFYQVYRTNPVSTSVVDPGDEMFLVYEDYFNATDVTNGYAEVIDYLPANLGGTGLYTNASSEGPSQANSPCEAINDGAGTGKARGLLTQFAGCTFGAVFRPRLSTNINLLSVLTETGLNARAFTGDTNASTTVSSVSSFTGLAVGQRISGTDMAAGTTITALNSGGGTLTLSQAATGTTVGASLVAGDILTIDGVEYYAHNAESIANREFLVSVSATASIAIRDTCLSFVRVFNRSASTTRFYAHYRSLAEDYPGEVYIVARSDRSTATRTIKAGSHGTAWEPNLTAPLNFLSTPDNGKVTYSKPNKPLAWPAANSVSLPEGALVTGFSSLRGALLVWSTRGLYRITGSYGNFRLELMDASLISGRDESSISYWFGAEVLGDYAYSITTKGLTQASEAGSRVVSDNVNPMLLYTAGNTAEIFVDPINQWVFVPMPTASSLGTLVYHAKYDLWTEWANQFKHGVLGHRSGLSRLHFVGDTAHSKTTSGVNDTSYAQVFDSSSSGINVIITAVTATTVTIEETQYAVVGNVLLNSLFEAHQTILSVVGGVCTVTDATGFSVSTGSVLLGFTSTALYNPPDASSVSVTSSSAHVIMDTSDINYLGMDNVFPNGPGKDVVIPVAFICRTNTDAGVEQVSSSSKAFYPTTSPEDVRFVVPKNAQRFNSVLPGFTAGICFQRPRFIGIDVDYQPVSDRTKR